MSHVGRHEFKDGHCQYKGCNAGPEILEREYQAALATRNTSFTYALFCDQTGDSHGNFDSLEEARGAAAYDRLKFWTIYHAGYQVERKGDL